MYVFKEYPHVLEGNICPSCGVEYVFCEVKDCNNFATHEGWVKVGIMLQRHRLCKEHVSLTEAYKARGEKVFGEATKQ